ncbi:23140_t:CDS:2, partial [Gigaspora rosea]
IWGQLSKNKGSYIYEIISSLIDIVISDLPIKYDLWSLEKKFIEICYLETGQPDSTLK